MARVVLTCQELIAYETVSAGKKRVEIEVDLADLEDELKDHGLAFLEDSNDRE